MTLHDAIICILKSHGTAMSYSDIAEEIYSKGLYLQEKALWLQQNRFQLVRENIQSCLL